MSFMVRGMHRYLAPLLLTGALAVPSLASGQSAPVTTEIIRDGSLGNPDLPLEVPGAGGVFEIGEAHGQRPGGGSNLFHSFEKFNVGTGDTALFTADPVPTDNVISRVTGGDASSIYGTIASDIAGADLYLLNSSGILFGPDARLDVQGSFHASTADFLRMADELGTDLLAFSEDSRLAFAHPAAFGFLGAPTGISVAESSLQVPEGQTLSFVGGDLRIDGAALQALGGRIQLASVASAGEVPVDLSEAYLDNFERLGSVELTNALLDVDSFGGSDAGRISVSAGDLLQILGYVSARGFDGSDGGNISLSAGGLLQILGYVLAQGFDGSDGGTVSIKGGDLTISRGGGEFGGAVVAESFGDGNAGEILIEVKTLSLEGGGGILVTWHREEPGKVEP